ncbi:MAG: hypothetical protein ACE5HJ_02985 [Thermoplasmata archaeon]
MERESRSDSLEAVSISAYLKNRVSGSIVYLLSLIQPLTLSEIRTHPLRLQYFRTMTGREPRESSLRSVVRRGVDLGLLVALSTRRENYYFLNSDLAIRPPSLEEDGEAEVLVDSSSSIADEDICLPAASALGGDHPIPLLRDPSTALCWFQWLSDSTRREVLRAIHEKGAQSRRELALAGARVGMIAVRAGIRCGVLRLQDDRLDFQFSQTRIPPSGKAWTARPPRFWLSRSYEPLRCVQGCGEYIKDAGRKSPMSLLEEMSEDGKKVLPARRREHLRVNLLYEAAAIVPRIEDVGPGSIASIWENRRGWVYPVREGYERAMAVLYLRDELSKGHEEGLGEWKGEALRRLAHRKLEMYFKAREEELMSRLAKKKASDYGLGPDAIMSLASVELERERLLEERKYFERFLEVIDG